MNKIRLLLKYIAPYKRPAVNSIIFNMLSALFALVSYTLAIPFLNILFNRVESVPDPGKFQISFDYLTQFFKFYLAEFIERNGPVNALLLVSLVFTVASLFKNGFIFLANNSLAYIIFYRCP
jgi:subfamily B ATP-binding cassette protein MsbA